MAVKRYRVIYKDGRTQEFEANSTRTTKEFVFFEKDGNWVNQVAADSVESVSDPSVPEPELPGIEQGELRR